MYTYIYTIHMIRWDMFFLNLFKHASFHMAKLFISYCHAAPPRSAGEEPGPVGFWGEAVEDVVKVVLNQLVVSTPLKNISQNGNLPQIGVKKYFFLKPPPSKVLNKDEQKNTKDISHIIRIILLANRLNLNDLYTPLHKMRLKSIIQ